MEQLSTSTFWSPLAFALLLGVAVLLVWQAFAPRRRKLDSRLADYVEYDVVQDAELSQPFARRVLAPGLRSLLRAVGALMPKRNLEKTQKLLIYAGEPGGLSVLDFMGIRTLSALAVGFLGYQNYASQQPFLGMMLFTAMFTFVGYWLPLYWLRRKAKSRQNEIRLALPDALDMLTIVVEAGLAFESGMLKVGEQWQNALSTEFRRTVAEMRMGVTRNTALERLATRNNVDELSTFVAVLVQSTQLGVSIAQVLNTQAAQMREVRRQRAEELARQASVKMVLVLAVFFFPALFIVVLGPIFPSLVDAVNGMSQP